MLVKMLTHLHMVVYSWWCWRICKGGGVLRGVWVPIHVFEKIKRIFSIAPVGNSEKSRDRTHCMEASDAGL